MKMKTDAVRRAKAQAALEYMMLLGGVLVLIVLIILLLRNSIFTPTGNDIGNKSDIIRNLTQNLTG